MREASQPPNDGRDPRHPRRRRRWIRWVLVPVATLVVLALVAAAAGWAAVRQGLLDPAGLPWDVPGLTAGAEPVQTQDPQPATPSLPAWPEPVAPLAGEEAGPIDEQLVAGAVAGPLRDPDLGKRVVVAVGGLAGGDPVWTRGPASFIPASTTKLVTVAAVLQALGPDARFTTSVFRGAGPREVVLVGGGDPYLASKPAEPADEPYPPRADLATLAAATAEQLGGTGRVRVRYEDDYFTGPSDNPQWRDDYVADDIVSPITALMVDGGRESDGWHRYDDPSLAAARAFAKALGEAGLRVVGEPRQGGMTDGAVELASVQGATLAQVAERVLDVSDNEAAEVLARHVGIAVSGEGSFTAGAAGVLATVAALGVDTTGAVLHDGSGLSRHNLLPTRMLVDLLRVAASPQGSRIRSVVTGLPVAGFTGSLTWRFDDEAPWSRGAVRAKTGTLTGVHALAGLVTGRDGVPMVFVVAADRAPDARKLDAQLAVDHVAAALATCRCSGRPG